MQTAIPCLFMRGDTSRGPLFRAGELPADTAHKARTARLLMRGEAMVPASIWKGRTS